MTIEISGNNYGKFGVYKLTEFGTRQLGSCFKKPFKEHFACQKVEFYTEVDSSDYTFADFELLQPSFEYNACKEEVMIPNLDGQDDGLDDPCPTFDGKTLQNNNQYICYLNAVVNGLLSLKKFRELIEFMEPTMKDYFTSLLDDKMKDLEPLRKTLHEFNSNFPIDKHSDPCEALTQLILLTNVDNLHQKSLVDVKRNQLCTFCGHEATFSVYSPYGNSNILMLNQSNENNVQDEIDNYINNFGNNESRDVFCRGCQEYQLTNFTDSIKTNEILIIRICRFGDNFDKIDKEVTPNDIILIGTSRYKLKCYISHHGQSARRGHYKSTIPRRNNCLLTFDDEVRIEKTEHTKDPYMLFYERMDADEDQLTINTNSDIDDVMSKKWKELSDKSGSDEYETSFEEQDKAFEENENSTSEQNIASKNEKMNVDENIDELVC